MDETRREKRRGSVIDIRCKAICPPPGTKSLQRLPRGLDDEAPSGRGGRNLTAGLVVAALAVGAVVGRFLLP